VFFTDVRIPDSQRLGPVGDGWKVSLVTLMNERLSIGAGKSASYKAFMEFARQATVNGEPAINHPSVREKIADWYVQTEGVNHTQMRTITAMSKGQTPGPENSIAKIISAVQAQEVASEAVDLLDQYGIILDPTLAPDEALFEGQWLSAPGLRIAGGTDEILRNIIAERVLGLPGEIRVDKDVPFKDMPTGR
jgi:alkylation response protein AidB-like acyl-CoA dehydrogenase